MSRRAPVITALFPTGDGSIRIEWDLDRFFPDPEEPSEIWVTIQDDASPVLPGGVRNFEIPAEVVDRYAGRALIGQVYFKWAGPPDEVLESPFFYFVPGAGAGPGRPGEQPGVPTVTLVSREPKTLQHDNRITIKWSSSSLTRGEIIWGPRQDPRAFTSKFKQKGTNYSGTFTTSHPLAPRAAYTFLVRVENTFHNRTAEAAITVTAVDNHRSVRAFLAAGGVRLPTGVRAHLPAGPSLRKAMGV